MVKKLLFILVLSVFLIFPPVSLAEGEFRTIYDVSYNVGADGVTEVVEDITLKNTTDKYYASSYSLAITSTTIFDVVASDRKGSLETQIKTENGKTMINVKFSEQIVGLDKEYKWTLRFKSRDFAEKTGKVWQVNIPRAPDLGSGDEYSLLLSVLVSFGDPTSMSPKPVRRVESGGRIRFHFGKEQMQSSGILANFGQEQVFNFEIEYPLVNRNVLPVVATLPLPPDTNFQRVVINDISPKPENVVADNDGNYVALFRLNKGESTTVKILGSAKLSLKPLLKLPPLSDEEQSGYLGADKYWDVGNPSIQARLQEIFKDLNPKTNEEKARIIDKFVSGYLQYNFSRVEDNDFNRLGALAALNNPTEALCGEYADLFVTLARQAGVPARRLEGYAYTTNKDIRPLSLGGTVLHAWVEYYDPNRGWIMIDPTWESANDGVDYFNQFDLNHIVFSILGEDSELPSAGGRVEVSLDGANFNPRRDFSLSLDLAGEILAGLPSKVGVSISNTGNAALDSGELVVDTLGLPKLVQSDFVVSVIPPFGHEDFETKFSASNFWSPSIGLVEASYSGKMVEKSISIKPFYQYSWFMALAGGATVVMLGVYGTSLYLHLKQKRDKPNQKKGKQK